MDFKEQASKEIEGLVKKFRKQTDKIESSDHPKYSVPGTREYEVDQLKAELEQQVEDINARYREQAEAYLEQAKRDAALSYFKPSVSDRELVNSIVDDFTASIAFARSQDEKREVFEALNDRLHHMSEAQLYAVKSKLPQVLQSVKDDEFAVKELKNVNGTLSKLQTPEQEALEEAKQLALTSPDHKFRTLKMTHRAYNKQKPIGGIE
jgi:vacuolar-type H+-ATPase subunit E/Vma4